jgi:hypothetical protein
MRFHSWEVRKIRPVYWWVREWPVLGEREWRTFGGRLLLVVLKALALGWGFGFCVGGDGVK